MGCVYNTALMHDSVIDTKISQKIFERNGDDRLLSPTPDSTTKTLTLPGVLPQGSRGFCWEGGRGGGGQGGRVGRGDRCLKLRRAAELQFA